jgi:hypothetical protein
MQDLVQFRIDLDETVKLAPALLLSYREPPAEGGYLRPIRGSWPGAIEYLDVAFKASADGRNDADNSSIADR